MQSPSPVNSDRTTPFSPIFNLRSNSNDNTILIETLSIISKIAPSSSQGNIDSSNYILSLTNSVLEEIPPGTKTDSLNTLLKTLSKMQENKSLRSSYNAPENLQIEALQVLKELAPTSSSPRKGMLSPFTPNTNYERKSPLTRERVNSINSESSNGENEEDYFDVIPYNLETIIENADLETPLTSRNLFNQLNEEPTAGSKNYKPFSVDDQANSSFTRISTAPKETIRHEQGETGVDILASSLLQDLLRNS